MNWKRFLAVMFALLTVLTIGSNRAAAQTNTTGDVTGVVTDPSGSVVPDAKITLKSETKGTVQESTSGREGTYRFYLLSPGPYTVTVNATGFQAVTQHVDVAVGIDRRPDQLRRPFWARNVGVVGHRLPAGGDDLVDHPLGR